MANNRLIGDARTPEHANCPMHELLSRLGDKWSMLVLASLARVPGNRCRFSELMRLVNGISQRMLTATLRHLERDGIVTRHAFAEIPPRVEYVLTERGQGLLAPVTALMTWISDQWPAIEKSRHEYDARSGKLEAKRYQREVGPSDS